MVSDITRRRMRNPFNVFHPDAIAYPGNSGTLYTVRAMGRKL